MNEMDQSQTENAFEVPKRISKCLYAAGDSYLVTLKRFSDRVRGGKISSDVTANKNIISAVLINYEFSTTLSTYKIIDIDRARCFGITTTDRRIRRICGCLDAGDNNLTAMIGGIVYCSGRYENRELTFLCEHNIIHDGDRYNSGRTTRTRRCRRIRVKYRNFRVYYIVIKSRVPIIGVQFI